MHPHTHIRKRKPGLEPYPARTLPFRILDGVVYAVGILGPLFTIPQIYKIYVLQSADGISLITWLAYAAFNIPWILYGWAHAERPIAITYTLWFIVNMTVCIGAITYGNGDLW